MERRRVLTYFVFNYYSIHVLICVHVLQMGVCPHPHPLIPSLAKGKHNACPVQCLLSKRLRFLFFIHVLQLLATTIMVSVVHECSSVTVWVLRHLIALLGITFELCYVQSLRRAVYICVLRLGPRNTSQFWHVQCTAVFDNYPESCLDLSI